MFSETSSKTENVTNTLDKMKSQGFNKVFNKERVTKEYFNEDLVI